jgi:hypothetical protein
MRRFLIVAALLLAAAPAVAEDAGAPGRYAIQPSDDGFVRLDTESGAVSHCRRTDNIWRCQPIADDKAILSDKIDTLTEQVESLTAELGRLKTEIDNLSETRAAKPTATPTLSQDDEKEFDRAMGFAERLMKRFFDMVRDLQAGEKRAI